MRKPDGKDGNTPGECKISVRYPPANYPVLIGGINNPPNRGHSGSLQLFNKRQSTVSDKIGDTQKFDTSVDRNLANYGDSTSIFSKDISRKLSHSSSADLYLRCWVDFASNSVRTEAPKFMDVGLPTVNTLNEVTSLVPLITESEGRRMDPIGLRWIIFLEKLHHLE